MGKLILPIFFLVFLIMIVASASDVISYITIENIPPQYSLNSTSSIYVGTSIEHRLKWNDDSELSGYVFSFDNCTGKFVNDTFVYFGEIPHNSSNWRDRLAGLWHMNENSGNIIFDYSPSGNSGSVRNKINNLCNLNSTSCVSSVNGKFGQSTFYNGTGEFTRIPKINAIDPAVNGVFTWSMWFKTNGKFNTTLPRIMDKDNVIVWTYNSTFTSYRKLAIEITNANGTVYTWRTGTTFLLDKWINFVFTFNNNTGDIHAYINGIETTLTQTNPSGSPWQGGIIPSTANLIIGNSVNLNRPFNGTIDEVAIWDRVLSAQEISTLYSLSEDLPNSAWSNVTKVANFNTGCTIRWMVFANDNYNFWNASNIYVYKTNSSMSLPKCPYACAITCVSDTTQPLCYKRTTYPEYLCKVRRVCCKSQRVTCSS
jgi:hypothetical protein